MKKRFGWQFVVAFGIGFLGFILFAHYIDRRNRVICFDCAEEFGFPFTYLETGGQMFAERMVWQGLFGNLIIAMLVGVVLGFIWNIISPKLLFRKDVE